MTSNITSRDFIIGLVVIGLGTSASGQTDWPTYGHDPASTRYSPLKQIDRKNVDQLVRAWTYHMKAPGRGRSSEATPIVVNGVMYLPTPYNRVVALQPETGKELWTYEIGGATAATRGVEY